MAFTADKVRQGVQQASTGGYDIDNSLRFNDDDSAYLSIPTTWTPNRETFTFSCWLKRTTIGERQMVLSNYNGSGSGKEFNIGFAGTGYDKLYIVEYNGGVVWQSVSTAVFRDTSAWYHIVVAIDTTQSTSTDRVKAYVNGEKITSFESASYPTLGYDNYIGGATGSAAVLGMWGYATWSVPGYQRKFDGYLAEVNFIDGYPSEVTQSNWASTNIANGFGEFDATYGHWKPIAYAGTDYGTNGFYLPMGDSSLVSASGGDSTGTDGKYKYHIFSTVGSTATFTVSSASAGSRVEYLVIAGGGGGASSRAGGGGGAGGYRTGFLTVSTTGGANNDGDYAITVGDGGAGGSFSGSGVKGGNSVFSTITSTGGGFGSKYYSSSATGGDGGSGGGAGNNPTSYGGSGNEGSYTPVEGYNGGNSTGDSGGGGGGSSSVGSVGTGDYVRISGGNGTVTSIIPASAGYGDIIDDTVNFASGGGGVGWGVTATGTDNTNTNTGNGGDAEYTSSEIDGRAGSKGIVIIRYKFQG